jgi:3-deoxy-D-arabino-heptulosonate 7-phosphate (DAHP) synthase class II
MNFIEINTLERIAQCSRALNFMRVYKNSMREFKLSVANLKCRHEELALKVDSTITHSTLLEERMKAMSDEIVAIKARLDSLEA